LPCSIAALAWLVDVDTTVAGWEYGKGTIERLHQLAARGWRPMDCDLINGYSAQLERWSFTAEELLDEHPSVALEVFPYCADFFRLVHDEMLSAARASFSGWLCT
jgi:hypothetical protein